MDFKRPERKTRSTCSSSEIEAEREAECQRKEDNGDEVKEFSALLDRIQETGEIMKQQRTYCSYREERSVGVERKSLWKPSFDWEDFSNSGVILVRSDISRERAVASKEENPSIYGKISKPDIKTGAEANVSSSTKAMPNESLDLNLGLTSEEEVPTTLQLFR